MGRKGPSHERHWQMICDLAAEAGLKRVLAVKRAFEMEVELTVKKDKVALTREQIKELANSVRLRMMEERPEQYKEFIKHIEY